MAYGAIEVEEHLKSVFRRCVKCPSESPSCPNCGPDETCSLQAESCNSCASTICVKVGSLPGQASAPSSTPVGAIAGGVIGGVAAIVIITWLVWRFCIRNRRKAWDEQVWTDGIEKRGTTTLSARRSTRSVASMTSTVLTRASNVIQIAYIPGVTNRSPPDSPALLAPPVPRIPSGATTPAASPRTPHFQQDAHFFMPGDLRDSTCSDMTEEQRHSIAPSLSASLARASVASTIYQNNAVVAQHSAQTASRATPTVIINKSGHTTPGSISGQSTAPPVPSIPKHIASSSIVGHTGKARPIEVRKNSSKSSVPTLGNLVKPSDSKSQNGSSLSKVHSDEKESAVSPASDAQRILLPKSSSISQHSARSSHVSATIPAKSPLGGDETPTGPSHRKTTSSGGLSSMLEDAIKRATDSPSGRPSLHKQMSTDSGPFSDSNETKENVQ